MCGVQFFNTIFINPDINKYRKTVFFAYHFVYMAAPCYVLVTANLTGFDCERIRWMD